MKKVPVVKPIEKGTYYVYCPYCGCKHTFYADKKVIEEAVYKEDGYTRIVQEMKAKSLCNNCGTKFIVDFGKSTYTVYDMPIRKNYQKYWTEFESDWYYDFKIIVYEPNELHLAYMVECEKDEFSYLLMDPYMDNIYMKPKQILELGMAHADTALYPK